MTCTKHVHTITRDQINYSGERAKEILASEFWERVHEAMNSVSLRHLLISTAIMTGLYGFMAAASV